MPTLKLSTEEFFQKMTHEEIYATIKEAKSVLELRLKIDSVYEPTSNPDIDDAHSQHIGELEKILEKLALVE